MKKIEVTIHGRVYDLENLADATSIQAVLVPDNWKGRRSDCVRLMQRTQEMLAHELKRHLAHNWQRLCKTAIENKEDGKGASVDVTFKFSLDQSVDTLAAITDHAMGFSAKYGTKGKPKTSDLAQAELNLDPSETVDAGSIERESTAADEEQARLDKEADAELDRKAKEAEAGKVTPLPGAQKDKVTQPGGKGEKPKRSHKKKVAAPASGGEK